MYVRRRIRPVEILRFNWRNLAYLFFWSSAVTAAEVWLKSRGSSIGLPFAPLGTMDDVPMSAICRNIEIDLRQFLGESDLPQPLQPVNDVQL